MYARVTILDDVPPRLREETWRWVETEGRQLEQALPGYRGVLTLVDAENRRTIRVHLHDTQENLRAAHAVLEGEPPATLPEELRQIGAKRSYTGLCEVVQRDGV